jgi:opacity protein-like surface antigen
LTNPYCTFLPGVAVGFNIQNGSIVFGLEADAAIGFTENVTEYSYYYWGTPQFDVTKTDKLGFLATLRGRVGFAVDNALFYMTAGAGLPSAAHTWIEDDDVPDSWQTFHNSKLGMVVGLGFEHRLGQKFAIKVEYLHFANLPVVQPNAQTHPYYMSVDEKVGILRLGFNILF